ncbi:DUF2513 domain-containing protein [Vibrio splendidus]|uniref:DUF2513 domain-containing protein n=1 Tax=Vibrio splendidus TaxID=29497 RepID=UPI000C86191C|nr:DUF2513 domain-containing protein [Vibrio splendidus]PMI83565.1 hypothetical protein BCU37_14235 [Vibrio splendidus]PMK53372.1 hypothetical protein BCT96_23005 [Vibrio splendidus]
MKRDVELGRMILTALEEREDYCNGFIPDFNGYSENQIMYHIKILSEAKLIIAISTSDSLGTVYEAVSLTNAGHDFLDAARSESNWIRAKNHIIDRGCAVTFETLSRALQKIVLDNLSI